MPILSENANTNSTPTCPLALIWREGLCQIWKLLYLHKVRGGRERKENALDKNSNLRLQLQPRTDLFHSLLLLLFQPSLTL